MCAAGRYTFSVTVARNPEKRINIPLDADTHRALRQLAGSAGVTMYELAAKAVVAAVEGGAVTVHADPRLGDVRVDEALKVIGGDPDAGMSVARHYMNLNKPYLAAVVATFAAERAAASNAAHASRELTRFAGERLPISLKIALLERAVAIHDANLVARNLLGQQLYFDKRYKEAIEHLAKTRARDNRARLFHGFALLRLSLPGKRSETLQGRDEVVEALRTWSFGNRDPQERARWIRQVAELDSCGSQFAHTVDELIEEANMTSDWKEPISRADISVAKERLTTSPESFE